IAQNEGRSSSIRPVVPGNLAGVGQTFLRDPGFRQATESAIKELQDIGYNAGQINDIFSNLANKSKGPGEATARILKFTSQELEKYNKELVRNTKQQNRANRIINERFNKRRLPGSQF